MSAVELTPEQAAAVNNEGGAILVSAAAGSGKTRVLVERLMRKIEAGADVTDFLIITYTTAAAAELRGKIIDALYERMADGASPALYKQVEKCGGAQIGTIHSFCLRLIRDNAAALGISPEYRVADEAECRILKRDTLEDLLEEMYDSGDEAFRLLADTLGAGRDDSTLVSAVLDTHVRLLSHPAPGEWVERQLAALDIDGAPDASETVWGRLLMEGAYEKAEYLEGRLVALMADTGDNEPFLESYGESLTASFAGVTALKAALSGTWDEAREAADFPKVRARPLKGCDALKEERKRIVAEMDKLADVFHDGSDKLLADMRSVAPAVRALLKLVLDFDARFSEAKRRRGILDFSDQEHMALRLLTDESIGARERAEELSKRYAEIMIDEYQDVNGIQEAIFNAVSRSGRNVFMVGDVKQSIYRFRLADPSIFLRKYAAFRDASEAQEGEERRVVLSRNFRSREGILNAVNFIFQLVMSEKVGDIDYTERESLYPGLPYPGTAEPAVELDVIDLAAPEDADDKSELEARYAASRILELVGKPIVWDGKELRRAEFSDFAVLMRSPGTKREQWAGVFARFGIPMKSEAPADIFKELEVSLTMSLLNVIDNPRQDVPLASVMMSMIYRFTEDEMAGIRAGCRDGDLYSAVRAAAENGDSKCAAFLEELSGFRELAPELSTDRLLWHIYGKTRLLALVSALPDPEARRANLMTIFEYARSFERSGFKGLFGFVSRMRRVIEEGAGLQQRAAGAENAVTLMSIHKSKGLEFPVVILAGLAKKFNDEDLNKPLLIHPELGLGPTLVDVKRRVKYPTAARTAVRARLLADSRSEELRVLYVAMTRARDKLIMLCSLGDAGSVLPKLAATPVPTPHQRLRAASSMAEWILIPALRRQEAEILRFGVRTGTISDGDAWDVRFITEAPEAAPSAPAEESEKEADEADVRRIAEALAFRYPFEAATRLASKVTATELKGTWRFSEAAEDAEPMRKELSHRPPRRPDFMEGRRELTAAEKGTAVHVVMQFADFDKCLTEDGVRAEIERLRRLRTLTDEAAKSVRPWYISDFFASEAGRLILTADKLWRELKFSQLVDSGELGREPGESVLLQGVVDCCVMKDGKLTVIDFKTDHVKKDGVDARAEYYAGQLAAYSMAVERMLKTPVSRRIVCFLAAGEARDV